MTILLKIVRYNEIFATSFGITINLFLIYLIFTVNKLNMKQFTRTLLQNCFLDLLFSISISLSQPQIVVLNGIYYNVVGSPFYVFGYEFASFAISAFGSCGILCFLAMPVPFYVRYLIICKNTAITVKRLILVYTPIVTYSVIVFIAAVWCYPPNPKAYVPYRPALMTQFWLEEFKDGPIFVATPASDIRLIIVFLMLLFGSCLSYTLISIFYIQIAKHLKLNEFQMSRRTMTLNKQLQKTLIVQTIGPFITGNMPCCVLVTMNLFSLENHYISLGCCCLFSWVSIINPLAAIIVITPYRNRVKQILRLKSNQIEPSCTNNNNYAVDGNNVTLPDPKSFETSMTKEHGFENGEKI